MLKYIELKTGQAGNGPAWVARVRASKSGQTIYFNGKALKRAHLPLANHYDIVNRESYWISGIDKAGLDRRSAESGKVLIEVGVVEEFLRVTGSVELDTTHFEVIQDFKPTDPALFQDQQNAVSGVERGKIT
jgi:hypothetical protein